MTSPRAARLAGALAAACAAVVVVLPGCRTALAAPNGEGHYGSSSYDYDYDHSIWGPEGDHMNSLVFNHESKSDPVYFWDRPAAIAAPRGNVPSDNVDHNQERIFYLLPALPNERKSENRARFEDLIDAHLDLAEAAMVEAAQSIHGHEPEAKYKHFFAEAKYKRFFKAKLSTLLETAKTLDPYYGKVLHSNEYLGRNGDETVVEAVSGLPPSKYKRWTVAKWIIVFAHDRCSSDRVYIKSMATTVDNALYRTRKTLDGLKMLVDKIENMANEFVKRLQADGESTEQKQSVMYTEYTKHYNQLETVLPMT